jgi:hypothetical protein
MSIELHQVSGKDKEYRPFCQAYSSFVCFTTIEKSKHVLLRSYRTHKRRASSSFERIIDVTIEGGVVLTLDIITICYLLHGWGQKARFMC